MRARSQLVRSWAVEINEHLTGNLLNRQKGAVLFGVSNGFATERSAGTLRVHEKILAQDLHM